MQQLLLARFDRIEELEAEFAAEAGIDDEAKAEADLAADAEAELEAGATAETMSAAAAGMHANSARHASQVGSTKSHASDVSASASTSRQQGEGSATNTGLFRKHYSSCGRSQSYYCCHVWDCVYSLNRRRGSACFGRDVLHNMMTNVLSQAYRLLSYQSGIVVDFMHHS